MSQDQEQEVPRELPHNHDLILQKAELHSVEDVREHFRAGLFLNEKTIASSKTLISYIP